MKGLLDRTVLTVLTVQLGRLEMSEKRDSPDSQEILVSRYSMFSFSSLLQTDPNNLLCDTMPIKLRFLNCMSKASP